MATFVRSNPFTISSRLTPAARQQLRHQQSEIHRHKQGLIGTLDTQKCMAHTKTGSSQPGNGRLRFDGQTAIITGAGRGLGREYALLLASRGANVIVNDYGGDRSGKVVGEEAQIASQVVEKIRKAFPACQAEANFESVSDEDGARRLVECALQKFGRVDILINNAGILRDKSFAKMSINDWDEVMAIHLRGSFLVSRTCWHQMKKQEYGKIVMTSSTSGLYGNFGQANYSAAKMGLIGLSKTIAIEGMKSNIHCNAVVPMAASRMTHDIIPEDLSSKLKPNYVAPLVAWLCHRDCQESGSIFEAAGQWFGQHRLLRSKGKYLPGICDSSESSVEKIADNWNEIKQFEQDPKYVDSFGDHLNELVQNFDEH